MANTNYRERMARLIDELETFRTAADGALELHEQFQELHNEIWDYWDELTNEAEEALEKLSDLDGIAGVCAEMDNLAVESFNGGRHFSFPALKLDAARMEQVRMVANS